MVNKEKPQISIVVPCYNEAGNIPLIIKCFKELSNNQNIEILLVNNGSTDNSKKIFAKEFESLDSNTFKLVTVDINQGYGYGILAGLKHAQADILWTHADMQTNPSDIITAFNKYTETNNEMLLVKGFRRKRQITEKVFSFAMQVIASLALKVKLTEINAQPKLFSRKFYEKFLYKKAPNDFSLDLYTCYCAKKYGSIAEMPVFFSKRIYGEAKGGGSFKTKMKLIKRTLTYIFELRDSIKQQDF